MSRKGRSRLQLWLHARCRDVEIGYASSRWSSRNALETRSLNVPVPAPMLSPLMDRAVPAPSTTLPPASVTASPALAAWTMTISPADLPVTTIASARSRAPSPADLQVRSVVSASQAMSSLSSSPVMARILSPQSPTASGQAEIGLGALADDVGRHHIRAGRGRHTEDGQGLSLPFDSSAL